MRYSTFIIGDKVMNKLRKSILIGLTFLTRWVQLIICVKKLIFQAKIKHNYNINVSLSLSKTKKKEHFDKLSVTNRYKLAKKIIAPNGFS